MGKRCLVAGPLLAAALLSACGGGGSGPSNPGTAVPESTITQPAANPDAPSVPANLRVTDVSANSVTLSWDPSTGGAGGIYSYRIRRGDQPANSGLAMILAQAGQTTLRYPGGSGNGMPLSPRTEYTFRVSAASMSGAESLPAEVKATTLAFDTMRPKLAPYMIVADDGAVRLQLFLSPEAAAAAHSGFLNVGSIQHAPVDLATHGVRKSAGESYEIHDRATGAAVETGLVRTRLPPSNDFSTNRLPVCVVVSMATGTVRSSGPCSVEQAASTEHPFPAPGTPVPASFGMYVQGERL